MTLQSSVAPRVDAAAPDAIDALARGLAESGYAVIDDWLPDTLVAELAHTCRALAAHGRLEAAGIGQGALRTEDEATRQTAIRWIEPPLTGAEADWLQRCDALRTALNVRLLLGLLDFECHYAVYPVGGFYRRHVDRFRTDDRRTLSCVLYLNDDWTAADGGELRLYTDGNSQEPLLDVQPVRGRFVTFLSDRFPHEVLPTRRERIGIAGWFRRRPLGAPVLD